jgi:hypothetical protein
MKENEAQALAAKIKLEVDLEHQGSNPRTKIKFLLGQVASKKESMVRGSILSNQTVRVCLLLIGVGARRL